MTIHYKIGYSTINYQIGYDTTGRRIVINKNGDYVTHIPCNMSEKEVLDRLEAGEIIRFDARNQGMQNIPVAQVGDSIPVGVAPEEKWPLFYIWEMNWYSNWDYHDMRTFEEFEEDFNASCLSPEEEFQIIQGWEAYLKKNPHTRITFEKYREVWVGVMRQAIPSTIQSQKR